MPDEDVNLKTEIKKRTVGLYTDGKVCACDHGYKGVTCSKKCRNGYGPNCLVSCPRSCPGSCDFRTGHCTSGCSEDGKDCHREVHIKPTVKIKPVYQKELVGARVEFQCIATGIPKPHLEWTRSNGERLNQRSTFKDGIFAIPSVTPSDASVYLCTASNRAGTAHRKAYLELRFADATSGRGEFPCEECTDDEIEKYCSTNDRQVSASFDVELPRNRRTQHKVPNEDSGEEFELEDEEVMNALARLRRLKISVENQTRVVQEMQQKLSKSRRCATTLSIAVNILITLCYCAQYAFRSINSEDRPEERNARIMRQLGNPEQNLVIPFQVTSSFPSNGSKAVQVRSMFANILKDFSKEYESEVLPGATIRKDSIKVGSVTSVKKTSSKIKSLGNANYNYPIYGGICLVTIAVLTLLVIFVLKRRKKPTRIRTLKYRNAGGRLVTSNRHRLRFTPR